MGVMKTAGPLPEDMWPYAERFFAWFPEVLVCLGSPALQDLYELPPHPGALMRLEETSQHKLVQVKLSRRQGKECAGDFSRRGDTSPFSKARAAKMARAAFRAAKGADMRGHRQAKQRSNLSDAGDEFEGKVCMPSREQAADNLMQAAPMQVAPTLQIPVPSRTLQQVESQEQHHEPILEDNRERIGHESPFASLRGATTPSSASSRKEPVSTQAPPEPCSPKLSSPGSHDPWGSHAPCPSRKSPDRSSNAQVDSPQSGETDPVDNAEGMSSEARDIAFDLFIEEDADQSWCGVGTLDGDGTASDAAGAGPSGALLNMAAACAAATPEQSPTAVSVGSGPLTSLPETGAPEQSHLSKLDAALTNADPEFGEQDIRQALREHAKAVEAENNAIQREASAKGSPQLLPLLPPSPGEGPRTKPLRDRRRLDIQIPPEHRRGSNKTRNMMKFMSNDSMPPEVTPPAVVHEPKFPQRPLPGAFPRHRTLIFFDWDDTLCPTTWIRELLKGHMADSMEWVVSNESDQDWRYEIPAWFFHPLPDMPDIRDQIAALQRSVIDVLNKAQSLGVVVIVTNAVQGWVETTTKKWLPHLKEYILGHGSRPPIQVLYGQREYKRPRPGSVAADLSWVDALGELMLWKKFAMSSALEQLDTLYRVGPRSATSATASAASADAGTSEARETAPQFLMNILTIGDSEAEMQSAELAALSFRRNLTRHKRALSAPPGPRLPGQPWVKALKLREGPCPDEIVEQLDLITRSLPHLVTARSHTRLEPEQIRRLAYTQWSEDPEALVCRLLRTQSI